MAVGLHARIPAGIWPTFYALIVLSMAGVGYHAAIADSRRSWMVLVLAISFSLVSTLIAALDRSEYRLLLPVPQQPLEDLLVDMDAGVDDTSR